MGEAEISNVLAPMKNPDSLGAATISSEGLLDALKMILTGTSLADVLTSITRLIEAHSDGMLCSIFLVEQDDIHLRYAAAPNLPEEYRRANQVFLLTNSTTTHEGRSQARRASTLPHN
jgi:hypothetical protein